MAATQHNVKAHTKLDSDWGMMYIEAVADVTVDIPDKRYNIKPSVDYFNITDMKILSVQVCIEQFPYEILLKDLPVEDVANIYVASEATILDMIQDGLDNIEGSSIYA